MIRRNHAYRHNVVGRGDHRIAGHGDNRIEVTRCQRVTEIAEIVGQERVNQRICGAQRRFEQVLFSIDGNALPALFDQRSQSRLCENSSQSVTAGANPFNQRALRDKFHFEFALHHLLLCVGIEPDMAYDSLPDELGRNEPPHA